MTIFQNIGRGLGNAGKWFGNACKAGWNNGNLAKGAAVTSAVGFGAAMTSAVLRDKSIFGGSHHHHGYGFGGGGLGLGTMAGYDTSMNWGMYSDYRYMSGMNDPYSWMGGSFSPYSMMSDMYNPFSSLSGTQSWMSPGLYSNNSWLNDGSWLKTNPWQDNSWMIKYQSPPKNTVEYTKYNHDYAGDINTTTQNTETGQAFDDWSDKFKDQPNSQLKIVGSYQNDITKYVEGVSEVAKSYGALIDKAGDSNGKITIDEYVNYVYSKEADSYANAAAAKEMIRTGAKKMDLNNDGKLDYKELAATMAAYDAADSDNKVTLDGVIKGNSAGTFETLLFNETNSVAREKIEKMYNALFPQESEE